jgi:hypothetical protein
MTGETAIGIALLNLALDAIDAVNKHSPENAITADNLPDKLAARQREVNDLAAKVDAS